MTRDFFRFWQVHAPHFTDHGETHSKTVEMNLDELIPDPVKSRFNEYETFLLLSSVWLHDIGIMCATKTEEAPGKIRANHHERSRHFVLSNLKELLNIQEQYVVGEICYAHRDFVPIQEVKATKTIRHDVLGNKEVRIRFLAGLLRLADSCDLCHTRTSESLADISKFSEETRFYHTLHERVSGISFDQKAKAIYIDIDIGFDDEKPICREYIVDKLQRSLDSVKNVLIRNGVFYIDVIPRFCKVHITTKLAPPKPPKKIPEISRTIPKDLLKKLEVERKARELYLEENYPESLTSYNKILEEDPDNALIWFYKAEAHSKLGELTEAGDCYEKCIELEPDNEIFLSLAGHFFGEICLDNEKSYTYFEMVFKLEPEEMLNALNFAEALVTMDRAEEAYNIATQFWRKATDTMLMLNAQFIRILSLFFKNDEAEGLAEIKRLTHLLRAFPPSVENPWEYNKIRRYIKESTLGKQTKTLLMSTLDLVKSKISVNDFEKKFFNLLNPDKQ